METNHFLMWLIFLIDILTFCQCSYILMYYWAVFPLCVSVCVHKCGPVSVCVHVCAPPRLADQRSPLVHEGRLPTSRHVWDAQCWRGEGSCSCHIQSSPFLSPSPCDLASTLHQAPPKLLHVGLTWYQSALQWFSRGRECELLYFFPDNVASPISEDGVIVKMRTKLRHVNVFENISADRLTSFVAPTPPAAEEAVISLVPLLPELRIWERISVCWSQLHWWEMKQTNRLWSPPPPTSSPLSLLPFVFPLQFFLCIQADI